MVFTHEKAPHKRPRCITSYATTITKNITAAKTASSLSALRRRRIGREYA